MRPKCNCTMVLGVECTYRQRKRTTSASLVPTKKCYPSAELTRRPRGRRTGECVTAIALAIIFCSYTCSRLLVEGLVLDPSRRFSSAPTKLHAHWTSCKTVASSDASLLDLDSSSPSRSRANVICRSGDESESFESAKEEDCGSGEGIDESRHENTENSEYVDSDTAEQRRNAMMLTSQLVKRSAQRSKQKSKETSRTVTSVGNRRIGSATHARQGALATGTLMDALIKTARGVAAAGEKRNSEIQSGDKEDSSQLSSRLSPSVIQSAIDDLLRSPTGSTSSAKPFGAIKLELSAAFSSFGAAHAGETEKNSALIPGSVLVESTNPTERTQVQIATYEDDFHIASLRLSVFSDFSPDLRSKFHARSCQALQCRRLRGAVCLVAKLATPTAEAGAPTDLVLGSAECSFHEFFGTRLGQRRPQNSVLYITEVAVNPAARRRGIGLKLLQAADQLARLRGTETLYLHVDVNNTAALALYEKAGYRKACCNDPIFAEFTRSLNLHPGATQGREHFLLYKDLKPPTWLSAKEWAAQICQQRPMGMLGFEIPA